MGGGGHGGLLACHSVRCKMPFSRLHPRILESGEAMGVSIKSAEAERKLRRVSRLIGKSLTATVIELADSRIKEIEAKKDRERRLKAIDAIVRRVKARPLLSTASEDEILGYNDRGTFD